MVSEKRKGGKKIEVTENRVLSIWIYLRLLGCPRKDDLTYEGIETLPIHPIAYDVILLGKMT